MHRFFVSADARTGRDVSLEREQAHQIARVLKLRVGEEIVFVAPDMLQMNGQGGQSGQTGVGAVEWRVRLVSVEAKAVRGVVVAERPALPEPTCTVVLAAAVLKGERFDWLIQKATELGVAAIQPLLTARTIARTGEARLPTAAVERWTRIAVEAAEQSGRGTVPEMLPPVPLRDMIVSGRVLVAHEAVSGDAGMALAAALPPDAAAVTLCIGPEGGFADDEVTALAGRHGAAVVSLGPRVLRAETAAMVAVTLALAATGNLAPPPERAWREIEGY